MHAAVERGLPLVVLPGGVDFIIHGPLESLPSPYRERKIMRHTPTITLVRTSAQETAATGEKIAEILSQSVGLAVMILPLRGFSAFSVEGQPLYDPEADLAFVRAFGRCVSPKVEVVKLDTHINDPLVAQAASAHMQASLERLE
jgi:uncharacterized protein (UPF0261 family)